MAEAHGHAQAHDHSKEPRLYAAVLGALLILTFITVGASYIQFGSGMVNVVIALTIATIKASLVALFFMHLLHDRMMNTVILLTSFFFLGLFLLSCYTDAATRDPLQPQNLKVQQPAAPAPAAPPASGSQPPAPAAH